ncbi:glutaryl-CoA dehydrogenase [Dyadobacter sp. BE34]|uniref:Glutaryl-CoA dehydrogenase n=1 Tax=Dyadobacter fermentans TaxID=94254 RepID=A0ABU1R1B5_9BACT|nr:MULTISPECIES: acyl-CoA dehydrogenase family protein [Dyadobacter]MDR6807192.1 glutaryl-CoA dehydrogenase [Dyadobacter fermentans]MDR7044933.1 glutaryl-CoA dehydrogenase [Dyadobacter sp. BE242]MDR7199331.1 glutaryl-CoA dehydrogenase [Dyadobacter sp. BE34]MDR7217291.1 glutaryl-CoA dehydrogenase [Dyadobacter sp. BE31]MDR7265224.1 glutaryl-CoA dehydrogenase [Dyadobacter sp. BE32]
MNQTDFFNISDLLTEEQRLIQQAVRDFSDREIKPVIEDFAQKAEFPLHLISKFGELGVFGPTIPVEYGGGGLDYTSYGLMCQEIEKGDSGMRSTISVQSSLVMWPIYAFGSEEQKSKYLPRLATGEWLGCFGLTEPDHGSNPGGMKSHITKTEGGYLLNGSKMWISNAPFAHVGVVWARNEAGRVQGVVVERGMEGFSTPEIHHKWSLRASATGELVFDNVFIPETHILPGAEGLKAPLQCLDKARYGIAWGAIGAAIDCYETAVKYAAERIQFDKPIGAFQLTQKKLAEMLTEITKAQLLAWRLGQLMDAGVATTVQISMAKRNNVAMALNIAREARQVLGAMGITGEYPIMRHMMNLESVITYEGTHDIHLLILGAEITGMQAFK